jgi:hypothetical protein
MVSPLGLSQDMAELPPIDQHLEKEHQEKTKVKNIQCVEMGKYEVRTSPQPCYLHAASSFLGRGQAHFAARVVLRPHRQRDLQHCCK